MISISRVLLVLAVCSAAALLTAPAGAAQGLDCMDCHDDVELGAAHAKEVRCVECHVDVLDERHEDDGAQAVDCGRCHEEEAGAVSRDIHHRLTERVGDDAPDCRFCHGEHDVAPVAASTDHVEDYCSDCHDNVLLVNRYHALARVEDGECLDCHDDADGFPVRIAASVHREMGCSDCHAYSATHLDEHQDDLPFDQVADCYLCHKREALEHRESIHGISIAEGVNEAANCWNCHGSHSIGPVDDLESPVHPANLAENCGGCHDDPEFAARFDMGVKQPGKMYAQSVHGVLVQRGRMEAANCALCHGVHDIKNRVQPGSPIASHAVPETCGNCHEEIAEQYERSVHWVRAKRGVRDAPVCNDCHSEHSIEGINVAQQNGDMERRIQEETCLRCHADPIIARRYNLNPNRVATYLDSYHGMAERRGDASVAMCVDCHGVHEILPQAHPASTVHPENVVQTCAQCHPDATPAFAASYTHEEATPFNRRIIYWVETIYIWVIWLVVGGMLLHNGLIFGVELRSRWRRSSQEITIPRFTVNEVVQHLLLTVTFLILVVTGFALTYPEGWIFRWLEWLRMTEPVRQNIHRSAGVVLIVLGGYHVGYLGATRRGRRMVQALWLRLRDVKGALANVAYYLGLRREPPDFDEFDYAEKAEYWALIWGTIVMAVTGVILWFPVSVSQHAPAWVIEVSTVIHFYEAVLASLAILIWHGFFVILHPHTYPLNFAMVDGRMTLQSYAHHHRQQFKRLLLEWMRVRRGLWSRAEVGYHTDRVLTALESAGQDPDAVLQDYLARDPQLARWVDERLSAD